ncbi:MAG: hypothetical protein K9L29_12325 [Spirochaetales bacterium]|nr:hypothetical protein [Spirochaetales bacterium]
MSLGGVSLGGLSLGGCSPDGRAGLSQSRCLKLDLFPFLRQNLLRSTDVRSTLMDNETVFASLAS